MSGTSDCADPNALTRPTVTRGAAEGSGSGSTRSLDSSGSLDLPRSLDTGQSREAADGGRRSVFVPDTGPDTGLDPGLDTGLDCRQPMDLEAFLAAGVLTSADLTIAAALARLGGCDAGDAVTLAVALCLRALRSGSVCLDLGSDPRIWQSEDLAAGTLGAPQPVETHDLPWPQPDHWLAALARSPLVACGPTGQSNRPLRLVGRLVYLQRYWIDELAIRRYLASTSRLAESEPEPEPAGPSARAGTESADRNLPAALIAVFGASPPDRQREAVAAASLYPVTVITGGPGTGKTTTVARIVAVANLLDPGCRVMLAAPTGKAATRLTEAVSDHLHTLPPGVCADLNPPIATTIHRMLGWRPGYRNRFRHDRHNPLPADLVIIDESSMVSLPQMARVLEAIPSGARLVLVGDADQLASVEAGAVLADLVAAPGSLKVVELNQTFRYGGAIADLASAIRLGDGQAVVEVLGREDPQVSWFQPGSAASDREIAGASGLRGDIVAQDAQIRRAAEAGDFAVATASLDAHRLLCAHREGRFGANHWSDLAQGWISSTGPAVAPAPGGWPIGQPLLVTANDYATELFNGDTGVVVATAAGPRAAFARGRQPLMISPGRLDNVVPLRAMTVHRSQGSQFGTVSVLLPGPESPILTRELLYTAITRARNRVRLIATEDAVRTAVARRVARASGLRTGASPG